VASGGNKPTGGSSSSVVAGGAPSAGGTKATGGKSSSGGSSTNKGGTSSIGAGGTTATGGTSAVVKTCTATGTLKQAAACNNKLIGAAISQGSLSNSGYANAAGEFNYFTPENEMKWDTVEGSRGSFNYGPGDAVVNFATQRGAKVKGHTLVWHSQLPGWVSSASDVKTVMVNHITSVMTHYKGKLHAWDVVNEAVDVDNKLTGMGNARLRDSVFKTKIGTDYIDLAFQTARKVDPSAKLFYNDFSTEGMNDKSDYVYKMVKSMKERGIPIDGVGIQTHIGTPNDSPTAAEVKQNIDRIAALGLEIQISELDVNGCDGITDAAMATIYHDLVAACVQQPLCTAVTVWGINDGRSWLNSFSEAKCNGQSARALLFTDSYQKKGTYTAVVNALTGN
jgi:endo-1,4-beta-xylanase